MVKQQEEEPLPNSSSSSPSSSSSSSKSTSTFTLSPRGDFMDILATKVTKILLKNADGPINDLLDQHLPKDGGDEIREKLPFYESTVDSLKFQRDQYLVGPTYAKENEERRRRQKQQQQQQQQEERGGDNESEQEQGHQQLQRFQPPTLAPFRRTFNIAKRRGNNNTMTTMPFDATALGHIQIVNIGQSFIPSPTVKNLLLPIVIDLPSGGLRDPVTNTAANSLMLAQPLLDKAMISSIKNVLDNPNMRQVIKNRTQGVLRVDVDVTTKDDRY